MARSSTSFQKGGKPGPGRPKGSKDRVPRGALRRAYKEFMECRGGFEMMVEAIQRGIRDPKRALGFLELGAKVLDRPGQEEGASEPRAQIVFKRLPAAAGRAMPATRRPLTAPERQGNGTTAIAGRASGSPPGTPPPQRSVPSDRIVGPSHPVPVGGPPHRRPPLRIEADS